MVGFGAFPYLSRFTQRDFEGHRWYWQNQEAGATEKHILEKYGTVARWNGPLGVRIFTWDRGTVKY